MCRQGAIVVGLMLVCSQLFAQNLGVSNEVLLEQAGEGHQVSYSQRGWGHRLDVKQIAGSEVPPVGYRLGFHRISLTQMGFGHDAQLHQYGGDNFIESNQVGLFNSIQANQGGSLYGAFGGGLKTLQLGYNNQLFAEQLYSGLIDFQQLGYGNKGEFMLEGGMIIRARQWGNQNLLQGGGSFGNQEFVLLQHGKNNWTQAGNFLAIGGNGKGLVQQTGEGNKAYVSLESGVLTIIQEGDANEAYSEIFRGSGQAQLQQLGNENQSLISQAEGSDFKADIFQKGHANQSRIVQFGNGRVVAEQKGNFNSVNTSQAYDYSEAAIRQEGDRNSLEYSSDIGYSPDGLPNLLTQMGNGNTQRIINFDGGSGLLDVRQEGDQNQIDLLFYNPTRITQKGRKNYLDAQQYYSGGMEIWQEGEANYGELLQAEGGSVMHSSQLGNQNVIRAYQASSGFIMEAGLVQEGNQNTIDGEQYADEPMYVEVHQKGNTNAAQYEQGYISEFLAEIRQSGDQNKASLTQLYGYSLAGQPLSEGVIIQEGNQQDAVIFQSDNYEEPVTGLISQEGMANQAGITQYLGRGNAAEIWQKGEGNQANILQEGAYPGLATQNAQVRQQGNQNAANLEQFGSAQLTYAYQEGNNNRLNLSQELHTYGNISGTQIGNENRLNVRTSSGEQPEHQAGLSQLGNGNEAEVYLNDVYQFSLHQEGRQNSAYSSALSPGNSQVSLRQIGDENQLGIFASGKILSVQEGNHNAAKITQLFGGEIKANQQGDYNVMDLLQYEVEFNRTTMDILQEGNGNYLEATQGAIAEGNLVVKQSGNNNSVTLDQLFYSSRLEAKLTQWGRGNQATIYQYQVHELRGEIYQWGRNNTAAILQEYGLDQKAGIYQWGSNNTGTIHQTYEASGSLGEIWQVGTNNEATLEQYYAPTNVRIVQHGHNQTVHITR